MVAMVKVSNPSIVIKVINHVKKTINPPYSSQDIAAIGIFTALFVFSIFMAVILGINDFVLPAEARKPVTPTVLQHDARMIRIQYPPAVSAEPQSGLPMFVWVANEGNHDEMIGVYLDVIPPGGESNPGDCVPKGRILQSAVSVAYQKQLNIPVEGSTQGTNLVDFKCSKPSLVSGQRYTLIAAVDVHADDFGVCAPGSLLSLACFQALADDDNDPWDNRGVELVPQGR